MKLIIPYFLNRPRAQLGVKENSPETRVAKSHPRQSSGVRLSRRT